MNGRAEFEPAKPAISSPPAPGTPGSWCLGGGWYALAAVLVCALCGERQPIWTILRPGVPTAWAMRRSLTTKPRRRFYMVTLN